MAALNAGNEPALLARLHFPHYRLAGGRMRVWDQPGSYLSDFLARAGADWHHSEWDFRNVIAAGVDKVHLDVQFTRYRADSSVIGSFRSLWIVTRDDCRPWRLARASRIDCRTAAGGFVAEQAVQDVTPPSAARVYRRRWSLGVRLLGQHTSLWAP